jgi:hypothetical protein
MPYAQAIIASRQLSSDEVVSIITRICDTIGTGKLTASTTISVMSESLDSGTVSDLRDLCCRWFNVGIPPSQWNEGTSPANTRTINDIADLLASAGAMVTVLPGPIRDHDNDSVAACIFSALRQAMVSRGASQQCILPSTSLTKYIGSYCLIPEAIKIAGPACPMLQVRSAHGKAKIQIMYIISIVLLGSCLLSLFATAFVPDFALWRIALGSALSLGVVSLIIAAGVERTEQRLSVVGFDTFLDLSAEIAQRLSALSEAERQDAPCCHL